MKTQEVYSSGVLGLYLLLQIGLLLNSVACEDDGSLFDFEPNFGASVKVKRLSRASSRLVNLTNLLNPSALKSNFASNHKPRSLFASGSEQHEIIERPNNARSLNKDLGQFAYKKNNDGTVVGQSTDGKNTQIIINLNHEPKSYIVEKPKGRSLFDKHLKDSYGQPIGDNDFLSQFETVRPPAPPQDYDDYDSIPGLPRPTLQEFLANYDTDYQSNDDYFYENSEDESSKGYLPPSLDSFDIEDGRLPSYGGSMAKPTQSQTPPPPRPPPSTYKRPSKESSSKGEAVIMPPSPPSEESPNKETEEEEVSPPSPPTNGYSGPVSTPKPINFVAPPAPPSDEVSSIYSSVQNPSRRGTFSSSSFSSPSISTFSSSPTFNSIPSSSNFNSIPSSSPFNSFPSSSYLNPPRTRTIQTLPNSLSSPSSVITYTSRILPQSSFNTFPTLPIPPPPLQSASKTTFSSSQRFSSPTFFRPPAPPTSTNFAGPPSPPTSIVGPPSPPTSIVGPPAPPSVIRPPSPIISPPAPPPVTLKPPITPVSKPLSTYTSLKVPENLSLQLQIIHRTTTPRPDTTTEASSDSKFKPSYKPKADNQNEEPSRAPSNNIEYHVHVNSVEQLAEITRLFGRNEVSSTQPIFAPSPTYEAPSLSDGLASPSYSAQAPPTYKPPRPRSPPRPTYEAPRSPPKRPPRYKGRYTAPRRQRQRPSKSNYDSKRANAIAPLSPPRARVRSPSKLQEILRLKCVFLCQFRQVEFQENDK